MTTLETSDAASASANRPGPLLRLFLALEAYQARRVRERALIHLSRYDAHMLRDIGIDPRDVEDALNDRRRSLLLHPIRPTGVR